MKKIVTYISLVFLFIACSPQVYKSIAPAFEPDYALNRFETTIKKYEQEDSAKGFDKGSILFYGSSSWYFWKDIKTALAPLPIINRGFGGSTIPELIYYADRMVYKYEPKVMVIYGGENDMSGSKEKSPEQVYDSYREFTSLIFKKLPHVKIYFVSMKLSPSRRQNWTKFRKGNKMIENYSKGRKLGYIEINHLLFNGNSTVKSELYTKDSLHINSDGYHEYARILKPILAKHFKENP
jgi:lysophospholipase L1-like esterase